MIISKFKFNISNTINKYLIIFNYLILILEFYKFEQLFYYFFRLNIINIKKIYIFL